VQDSSRRALLVETATRMGHNPAVLLRTIYSVRSSSLGVDEVVLPLELALGEGIHVSLDETGEGLRLSLDRPVDPSRIEIVRDSGWTSAEGKPLRRLRLPDHESSEDVLLNNFVNAVTFLTDAPLSVSRRRGEDRFIPENEEERKQLEQFGTDELYRKTGARFESRTFTVQVDADAVSALLDRSAGLRLYAAAMKLPLVVAQFRELWRVLESAFRAKDDALAGLLASYPPAREFGFGRKELKDLLVLRGKASHAESNAGVSQLIAVEQECRRCLPRLKNLVEWVILTKKTWGLPTLEVEALAPLRAYVGPEGEQVIYRVTAGSPN
jgi:hypothetical protein